MREAEKIKLFRRSKLFRAVLAVVGVCILFDSNLFFGGGTKLGLASKSTISVCIPAIPRDLDSGCLLRAVRSVRQQTVFPSEIIVALTNTTLETATWARTILQEAAHPIPIRMLRSTEIYVQGKSRNNAMLASDAEIISFFDADDEMHPNRLEVIDKLFLGDESLSMFLHGYTQKLKRSSWRRKRIVFLKEKAMMKSELCRAESQTRHQPHLDLMVHHAHLTIRRSKVAGLFFDEADASYRIEDSLFVRKVLAEACSRRVPDDNILFLDAPLSYYEAHGAKCAAQNSNSIFSTF